MNTPTQPALCDQCAAAPGLPMPHRPGNMEVLCPACAAQGAVMDDAAEHLHAMLSPALTAWARHWHAAGLDLGQLAGLLELEGAYWHPNGGIAREGGHFDNARAMLGEVLE